MTLTALVTKKEVSKVMPKLWAITLTMTLTEDTIKVFQSDHSARYRTGDSIAAKEGALEAQMQADIDIYKSEQNIFTSTQLMAVE